MTQDERWQAKYNEVMEFIETNHRNPSCIKMPGLLELAYKEIFVN